MFYKITQVVAERSLPIRNISFDKDTDDFLADRRSFISILISNHLIRTVSTKVLSNFDFGTFHCCQRELSVSCVASSCFEVSLNTTNAKKQRRCSTKILKVGSHLKMINFNIRTRGYLMSSQRVNVKNRFCRNWSHGNEE